MSSANEDFIKSRPQRLCKMCGKCCRLSTTPYSYEELKAKVATGSQGAIDFLDLFEPYPSIEAARTADAAIVDNIIKGLKEDDNYDEEKLTFYRCRYIQDDNLCGIYLNRKELCDRFPSSPWALVPPDCGFEGWLFSKREERKQKVRKLKENLLDFEISLEEEQSEELRAKLIDAIAGTNEIVEHYSKYGSKDW